MLTVGIYSRNHGYNEVIKLYCHILISIKRFQKSVGPVICNDNNVYYSIVNSRIIIRISVERAWHPLQENKAIFKKNFDTIFKQLRFFIISTLLAVEWYFASQMKGNVWVCVSFHYTLQQIATCGRMYVHIAYVNTSDWLQVCNTVCC